MVGFVAKKRTFDRIKGKLKDNIEMDIRGVYWKFKLSETK
jgi:hypothetical protein